MNAPTESTERLNLEAVGELAAYPAELAAEEAARRGGRSARVGLGLSGGGIRSATFALGLAQGLARAKLMRHVDLLSTVSGGGYFGSFFGHLLHRTPRPAAAGAPAEDPRAAADDVLRDPNAPAIHFLRANGRYLAPNGAGDLFTAAATVLRNWASALIVVGCVVLLAFSLLALVRYDLLERVGIFAPALASLPFWMSPWVLLIVAVFLGATVPLAWAFWLIRDTEQSERDGQGIARWIGLVVAALLAGAIAWAPLFAPEPWSGLATYVSTVAQATIVICLATIFWHLVVTGRSGSPHVARRHRSQWLARSLMVLLVLGVIALLDSVGIALTEAVGSNATLGAAVATIAAWFARTPLTRLAARLKDRSLGPVPASVALIATLAIILGYFGGIAAVPHFVFRAYNDGTAWRGLIALGALTTLLAVVVFATADLWYFLNRSSMHALYEARLRRAYLGASNPARTGEGTTRLPITEPEKDDGLPLHAYDPSTVGGPIHLINVCINETVDGRSQLQQRDRKGLGMAIGPAGVSVGVRHHARWTAATSTAGDWGTVTREIRREQLSNVRTGHTAEEAATAPFRVFPPGIFKPEQLEVGAWVAISGGAVSTGLGSRTNAAFSLLLGLFNVRLGYWWRSGVNVADRAAKSSRTRTQELLGYLRSFLPMQFALLDEWFARFPGTLRRDWYLTDGGHFENLGGYELIRRSLPVIVISDAESDAGFEFSGLANLVRKARTDFGAEIDFLGEDDLDELRAAVPTFPSCVGSLDAIEHSLAHAALARVRYRTGTGWLLYVKPTLDGDEPTDVRQYHRSHPAFPHESTGDQFFDEAQWESYRRLGEHIAEELVGWDSWLADLLRGAVGLPAPTPRP
ncbi:MAG: hypothetical protein K8S21_04365 [Gemmatimonadetes bacterium]|nr:hypothetical protein [Gemmatimonadota bacterium]